MAELANLVAAAIAHRYPSLKWLIQLDVVLKDINLADELLQALL